MKNTVINKSKELKVDRKEKRDAFQCTEMWKHNCVNSKQKEFTESLQHRKLRKTYTNHLFYMINSIENNWKQNYKKKIMCRESTKPYSDTNQTQFMCGFWTLHYNKLATQGKTEN